MADSILLGALALVPASDLALALLNRFVTTVVLPALLPRFDWKNGVPTECPRTVVAVPTMFTLLHEVEEQIERLEVHFLANADGDVYFALLSDFGDSANEKEEGDEAVLSAARDGIAGSTRGTGPRPTAARDFSCFTAAACGTRAKILDRVGAEARQASRTQPPAARRDRHDLSARRTPRRTACATSSRSTPTRASPGAVRRLVGTIAHPLNRPRFDPATRRVVEG